MNYSVNLNKNNSSNSNKTAQPKKSILSSLFHLPRKKQKDTIEVYGIFNCSLNEYRARPSAYFPVYITYSHEEALNAISRLVYQKNFIHFNLWVNCHTQELSEIGVDALSPEALKIDSPAWEYYLNIRFGAGACIDPSDPYCIGKIRYNAKQVSSFLRMLSGIQPLGLSSERSEEIAQYTLLHPNSNSISYEGVMVLSKFVPLMHADSAFCDLVKKQSQAINKVTEKLFSSNSSDTEQDNHQQ